MPLICETKPVNIHQIVAYQRNGCVKTMNESPGPETVKGLQHHIPIQVEQEETPVENHTKKSNSKDHCTIEINELETNVWLLHSEVSHTPVTWYPNLYLTAGRRTLCLEQENVELSPPACTGARRPAVNVKKSTQLARDMGFFRWKILLLKN